MSLTDRQLADLPTRDGFRLRGLATTRIETFTDAAFAFALTLLVLATDVPDDYAGLVAVMWEIPPFLFSAVLLMMFWTAHHNWSRRFGLDDTPTILLSCLLVFTVLVYVYPLRFMSGAMADQFSLLLGSDRGRSGIESAAQVNQMFLIYGAGFVAMCASILLLNLHAWRLRNALGLDALERHETRAEIVAWSIVGGAGVASMLLAIVLPERWAALALPGWTYSLLAIVMPIFGRRSARRRPPAGRERS